MKKKGQNKAAAKWIFSNSKRCIPSVAALTLLTTASALISLRFTIVSKNVIDIATKSVSGDLVHACAWLAGLLIVQLLISVATTFVNINASAKMDIAMKRRIFGILIEKDYLSLSKYHSGELLNRLTSDLSIIVSGIISVLPNIAVILTNLIGGFIILYRLDSFFALLILCVGPLILISARLYSHRYKQLHKDCQAADGKVRSFMQETLQNILVIKSFSNESSILDHNQKLQMNAYRLKIKRTTVSVLAHIIMFMAFNAGYYFALGYGAWKLSHGLITYGTVIAMLQLVSKIQTPFKNISGMVPQILSIFASTERILELEDMPDEDKCGRIIAKQEYAHMDSLVFDHVSFSYGTKDAPAISDISVTINKGETVVMAGESGSGKSTAVKLLLGIIKQQSGDIYINTDTGERIPVNAASRALFAYVPQGNLILSGTIRENIAFANDSATDEQLMRAADIAQIGAFIRTLPDGLDTELGEKGLGLSEGQIQRLAIARAVLYDAPIMLLDESTSALDSQTEIDFLNAIKQMTDKTCILVSHKEAAFKICDKVIDFNKISDNGGLK